MKVKLGLSTGFKFSRGDSKARYSKGSVYKTSKSQAEIIRKRDAKINAREKARRGK